MRDANFDRFDTASGWYPDRDVHRPTVATGGSRIDYDIRRSWKQSDSRRSIPMKSFREPSGAASGEKPLTRPSRDMIERAADVRAIKPG